MQLANQVLKAADADNATGLSGLYTDDAVIVDENPPFTWRGPAAGAAWWRVVEAVTTKAKITNLKAAKVRIGEFVQTSTDAYLIETMTLSWVSRGKPSTESGTMTYTFHNAGGKWLISTQVWTTRNLSG